MERVRNAWSRLLGVLPFWILAIGWIAFVIYAYPGLMANDSFSPLADVRSGVFRDLEPPMMQGLWAVLDRVVAGPFGLLVVQSLAFLTGAYLIGRRVVPARTAAVCAALLLLAPPVIAVMAVIWPHSLFAGLAMLGAGLVLGESRRARVAGLAVLAVAGAVRYNAPVATLPLIVLGFQWGARRPLARYGLAGAVWLATVGVGCGANRLLVDRQFHFWHASVAASDITGSIRFADELTDAELREILAGTPLVVDHDIQPYARAHYQRAGAQALEPGARLFDLSGGDVTPLPPDQRAAMARAWRSFAFGHPAAYLRHRLETFAAVLGLTEAEWSGNLIVRHDNQSKGMLDGFDIPVGYSKLQGWLGGMIDAITHTFVFKPWFYLALAIGLLVRRREPALRVLLWSAIALEASLFGYTRDLEFRNSHWLVCCAALVALLAIARGVGPRDRDLQ
jgi:hypothetical protein